jgi:hypothetical protein
MQQVSDEIGGFPYTTVRSEAGKSATIRIDLTDYVQAFDAYKENKSSETESRYYEIFSILRRSKTTFMGDVLFTRFMTSVMHGLDIKEQQAIENSPAYAYVREAFIEIVKNIMDESIEKYYRSPESTSCVAELNLSIDNMTNPDTISILLRDNGRGYKGTFLDKMNDPVLRESYMRDKGSAKQTMEDLPQLFGGAGRGLRNLTARVDTGSDLLAEGQLKECYVKPAVSRLKFGNHPDGGAMIRVETSTTPLERVLKKSTPASEAMPFKMPNFSAIKMKFRVPSTDDNPLVENKDDATNTQQEGKDFKC